MKNSSMRFTVKVWLGCLMSLLISAFPLWAADFAVEDAVLLESAEGQRSDYLVPLGTVKEGRDGRALPERFERVAGKSFIQLYQLPSELTLDKAKTLLLAMDALNATVNKLLYTCSGRECGQSNLWANDVFGKPLLFGNDRTQFAAVYVSEDLNNVTVLYASERPNRRSHYAVEVIQLTKPWLYGNEPTATQASFLTKLAVPVVLNKDGLPDAAALNKALQTAAQKMQLSSAADWAVIAYGCEMGSASDRFAHSQKILDAVLPALKDLPGKALYPINAGSAFPEACQKKKRLEIVELAP